MKGVWQLAISGLALCAVIGAAGPARAQTALFSNIANGSFTYGATSFTISGCSFNGTKCDTTDNAKIIGILNGRGGTELEIVPIAPVGTTSAIYNNTGGAASTALSFTLQVTPTTGNRGISSITDIIAGSAAAPAAGNSLVTAALSSFVGVTSSPTSISSNLNNLSTTGTFPLTSNPLSFNVKLGVASSGAASGNTLQLSNVKLLFQPAPEPATIGLLATGLVGLGAVRHRLKKQIRQDGRAA